ncbi:MAG: hypothetical protein HYT03_00895 [Candidatus Harrisonbacteria bacterium]|nr:hypothetical protein [Candidatus Harrisonbacteria bacterium]
MKLNKNQAGLALGSISALGHFLWVIIVAIGSGQKLADLAHSIHFLTDRHVVHEVTLGTAILGVVLALALGYITGWVFACLWNLFAKR